LNRQAHAYHTTRGFPLLMRMLHSLISFVVVITVCIPAVAANRIVAQERAAADEAIATSTRETVTRQGGYGDEDQWELLGYGKVAKDKRVKVPKSPKMGTPQKNTPSIEKMQKKFYTPPPTPYIFDAAQAGYTKPKVKEVTPSQSCYIIAKKVGTSDNKGLKSWWGKKQILSTGKFKDFSKKKPAAKKKPEAPGAERKSKVEAATKPSKTKVMMKNKSRRMLLGTGTAAEKAAEAKLQKQQGAAYKECCHKSYCRTKAKNAMAAQELKDILAIPPPTEKQKKSMEKAAKMKKKTDAEVAASNAKVSKIKHDPKEISAKKTAKEKEAKAKSAGGRRLLADGTSTQGTVQLGMEGLGEHLMDEFGDHLEGTPGLLEEDGATNDKEDYAQHDTHDLVGHSEHTIGFLEAAGLVPDNDTTEPSSGTSGRALLSDTEAMAGTSTQSSVVDRPQLFTRKDLQGKSIKHMLALVTAAKPKIKSKKDAEIVTKVEEKLSTAKKAMDTCMKDQVAWVKLDPCKAVPKEGSKTSKL